jgi:hypothetical protein
MAYYLVKHRATLPTSGLFLSRFPTKIFCALLIFPVRDLASLHKRKNYRQNYTPQNFAYMHLAL